MAQKSAHGKPQSSGNRKCSASDPCSVAAGTAVPTGAIDHIVPRVRLADAAIRGRTRPVHAPGATWSKSSTDYCSSMAACT